MAREAKYFALDLDALRAIGRWTADSAERALPILLKHAPSDPRPLAAIDAIRTFAAGGNRTATLRTLALAALAAAREAVAPAAAAAAKAAGLAAASAYTHPLADVQQTKHIVGPAAYAALALELAHPNDPDAASREVRWAVDHVSAMVREVLCQMPARQPGTGRVNRLLYDLDAQIRRPQAKP